MTTQVPPYSKSKGRFRIPPDRPRDRGGPVQVTRVLEELLQAHRALYFHYCGEAARLPFPDRYRLMRAAREELAACRGIQQFQMENEEGVLNTWVRFQDFPPLEDLRTLAAQEEGAVESLDYRLEQLCRALSGADAPPRVRELFANLQELETGRLRRRQYSHVMNQDL